MVTTYRKATPSIDVDAAQEAVAAESLIDKFGFKGTNDITIRHAKIKAEIRNYDGTDFCSVSFLIMHVEADERGEPIINERGFETTTYIYGDYSIWPDKAYDKNRKLQQEVFQKVIQPFLDVNGMTVLVSFSGWKNTSKLRDNGRMSYSCKVKSLEIESLLPKWDEIRQALLQAIQLKNEDVLEALEDYEAAVTIKPDAGGAAEDDPNNFL